jgi:hypothetical protein
LNDQVQKLHEVIKAHYGDEFEKWISREKLHPLQDHRTAKTDTPT